MNTYLELIVSALVGITVGFFYFAGLAWTIRKLPSALNAPVFFAVSMIVRILVTVTVFVLLSYKGHGNRLFAGIAGFLIARVIYLLKQNTPGHRT